MVKSLKVDDFFGENQFGIHFLLNLNLLTLVNRTLNLDSTFELLHLDYQVMILTFRINSSNHS
ncbi:hypothetical protein DYBT9623_02586 [Dyadobacter sp. CECT 9623]|uniref:Uncharacterized protein n=1 Tax=Dyadobacter linearis TaxID=2823330 RepID=A0ABN7R8T4_9BACT|nr:hypothetical protein DYBT9623_02586 [Dyadobacter sp. CECT 9623]